MSRRVLWSVVAVQAVIIAALVIWLVSGSRAKVSSAVRPPVSTARAGEDHWVLRSQHLLYGVPKVTDDRYDFVPKGFSSRVPGISLLVREGFVVGHCDRYKVPIWVSVHWSRESYRTTQADRVKQERKFRPDPELPAYAEGQSSYGKAAKEFDRGHLAAHQENIAWGADSADTGCYMSNVLPEARHLNRGPWLALEEQQHSVVAQGQIREIWVISGAILGQGKMRLVGNGMAVAESLYKIIAWRDARRDFHTMAFVFPQAAKEKDLRSYLVSVREIERRTGLDFFPSLEPVVQKKAESAVAKSLWNKD